LIEAGIAKGRKMTSYHSMATDVKNAGANWVDQEVVVDQGLITSRNPGDLEAFSVKIIEEIGEGRHERREGSLIDLKGRRGLRTVQTRAGDLSAVGAGGSGHRQGPHDDVVSLHGDRREERRSQVGR
jgi:hypothetical protein